ncbi:MAG: PHP domain-containing protein, partial [Myxococcota bacterium]|nr:PHP domain-containing protein [Myxococcota bacterium]
MSYAPLWCKSNFSFLEGASHAEELVEEAHRVGLGSVAITDRDGVYGMVRAHVKARELGVHLLCGAQVSVAAPGRALVASPVTITSLPPGDQRRPAAPGGDVRRDGRRTSGRGWGSDT